jgi:hypothetical protein
LLHSDPNRNGTVERGEQTLARAWKDQGRNFVIDEGDLVVRGSVIRLELLAENAVGGLLSVTYRWERPSASMP